MARRRHRNIRRAVRADQPDSPVPPTAETVTKLRRDVVDRLYQEGRLAPELLSAAVEIRRVWEAFGRGLFPGSNIGEGIRQSHRRAMFVDPIERMTASEEIAWRVRYRPWAREMALMVAAGTVRVSRLQLVLDVVVDNHGLRQVEGRVFSRISP